MINPPRLVSEFLGVNFFFAISLDILRVFSSDIRSNSDPPHPWVLP